MSFGSPAIGPASDRPSATNCRRTLASRSRVARTDSGDADPTAQRATMEPVEYFEGRFRFNPLVDWTQENLMSYIDDNKLPKHPLVMDGYPSIGCMPCTRRVSAGGSYREGRWAGIDKEECGIHVGVGGEGI